MATTNLLHHWESREMQNVGPGDADVHTKSNRTTTVKLNLTAPVVEQQAKRLKIHVVYDVIEGRSDFTHLQMATDILIPLPADWGSVRILGAADFPADMVIVGKNHQWNPVDVSTVNWIQRLHVKVDGPGDDASGNAGLSVNFVIPLDFQQV